MDQSKDSLSTLEQRFLEKQEALFLDILEGNELIPSKYVLSTTAEEVEAYHAGIIGGAIEPATEGLSPI